MTMSFVTGDGLYLTLNGEPFRVGGTDISWLALDGRPLGRPDRPWTPRAAATFRSGTALSRSAPG